MGSSHSKGKPKLIKIDKPPSSFCNRVGFCQEDHNNQPDDWLNLLKKECNDLKGTCEWATHIGKALSSFHGFPPEYFRKEVRNSVKKVEESRPGRERKEQEKKAIRQIYKKSELIPEESCLSTSQLSGQADIIQLEIGVSQKQEKQHNSSGSDGKLEGQLKSPPQFGIISSHNHSQNTIEQQMTNENKNIKIKPADTSIPMKKEPKNIFGDGQNNLRNSWNQSLNKSQIGGGYSINSIDHKLGNSIHHMNLSTISGHSLNSQPSYLLPQMYLQRKDEHAELSREATAQLEEYLMTTGTIANHLKQPEHVLCKMFKVFVFNFLKQHEPIQKELTVIRVDKKDQINEEAEKQAIQQAVLDVQQFTRVMQLVLVEFYQIQIPRGHFTTENLLNFVNAQIFHYKKVSIVLLELFRLKDIENERILKEIMNSKPEKEPQDFFVSDKLCLNERTLNHFKKQHIANITEESSISSKNFLKGKVDNFQIDQNILRSQLSEKGNSANQGIKSINQQIEGKDNDFTFGEGDDTAKLLLSNGGNTITEVQGKNKKTTNNIDIIKKKQEASKPFSEEGIEQFVKQYQVLQAQEQTEEDLTVSKIIDSMRDQPYFSSMKYLLKIESECSPIGKMKMIVKASETLLKCVNRYYSKHQIPQLNYLDGDEAMGLFRYLCTKCRLYQLNTHLLLVNEFVTSNLLNSASGFYVTSLQATLEIILNNNSFIQEQP